MTAAAEWWSERFPRLCAAVALAIGVMALAGWTFDLMVLASLGPGFTTMKPNTALAVILAAIAVTLLQQRGRAAAVSVRTAALAVGIIAAITLYEYRIGRADGFAQVLFADAMPMGVSTALGLLLLAGALVMLSAGSSPLGHGFALLAAAIGWLGILGYVYDVESLYTYGASPTAFLSAVALATIGAGTAAVHGGSPLVRILGSAGPEGSFARHLIPIALLLPVALGWLWLQGQRWQLYPIEAGVALFVASSAALFIAVVVFYALRLERAHEARAAAERGLVETTQFSRQIVETAQEGILVLDRNFRYVLWNPFMERLTGRPAADVLGRRIDEISPEAMTSNGSCAASRAGCPPPTRRCAAPAVR
jgi:PAS domain-containing protein